MPPSQKGAAMATGFPRSTVITITLLARSMEVSVNMPLAVWLPLTWMSCVDATQPTVRNVPVTLAPEPESAPVSAPNGGVPDGGSVGPNVQLPVRTCALNFPPVVGELTAEQPQRNQELTGRTNKVVATNRAEVNLIGPSRLL